MQSRSARELPPNLLTARRMMAAAESARRRDSAIRLIVGACSLRRLLRLPWRRAARFLWRLRCPRRQGKMERFRQQVFAASMDGYLLNPATPRSSRLRERSDECGSSVQWKAVPGILLFASVTAILIWQGNLDARADIKPEPGSGEMELIRPRGAARAPTCVSSAAGRGSTFPSCASTLAASPWSTTTARRSAGRCFHRRARRRPSRASSPPARASTSSTIAIATTSTERLSSSSAAQVSRGCVKKRSRGG